MSAFETAKLEARIATESAAALDRGRERAAAAERARVRDAKMEALVAEVDELRATARLSEPRLAQLERECKDHSRRAPVLEAARASALEARDTALADLENELHVHKPRASRPPRL